MRTLLSIILAAALLCGLAALADPGVPESTVPPQAQNDDSAEASDGEVGRFSMPRIPVPSIPQIEVPEMPDIEVPEVPTAEPTKKPKIEVPKIPQVATPEADVPPLTPDASNAVEVALETLGVPAYRALYDALNAGSTVGSGSRGDAAKGLQQMLVAFGQDIAVDGIVGPKTIAALNAVQAQYGLPQSDELDAAGFAELLPLLLTQGQEAP